MKLKVKVNKDNEEKHCILGSFENLYLSKFQIFIILNCIVLYCIYPFL